MLDEDVFLDYEDLTLDAKSNLDAIRRILGSEVDEQQQKQDHMLKDEAADNEDESKHQLTQQEQPLLDAHTPEKAPPSSVVMFVKVTKDISNIINKWRLNDEPTIVKEYEELEFVSAKGEVMRHMSTVNGQGAVVSLFVLDSILYP